MDLVVEVAASEAEQFRSLPPGSCVEIATKNFAGGVDVTTLLITLTPVVAPLVTKIILALIEARKHVSVEVDGAKLSGLSERSLIKLVETLKKSDG